MYAVLYANNWHITNHRYLTVYPKGLCFPKNNHRRLYATGNWINICNYEIPPKDTFFLVLWWCNNKKINQSDLPHFAKKHISAPFANFTITPNATTESEWKYSTPKDHQHTSTISEGRTCFITSEDATTISRTHNASKRAALNTPHLGSTFKSID